MNLQSHLLTFVVIMVATSSCAAQENRSLPLRRKKRDGDTSSTFIHPSRLKLLTVALEWMTLKRNGELMTTKELNSMFLEPIKEKYLNSKVYRSFVIAFQQGVLPRLTLNESSPCNPDYTWEYKDPWNSSVTWFYQKKFTFKSYDSRKFNTLQLCDYRQGLVCNPLRRICQCPLYSSMQYVDPTGNGSMRCLMHVNSICNLIDIDHGNDPSHTALANNLPHMIFDLEKPLGCSAGSQCRFKEFNLHTPFCHNNYNAPWHPPPLATSTNASNWTLPLGAECTLGLYADPGMCEVNSGQYGALPGLVCYNFGPPRSLKHYEYKNVTGFCAHEFGSYGLAKLFSSSNDQLHFHPAFMAFVHARNVPLRDTVLLDYYNELQHKVYHNLFIGGVQQEHEHSWCSVENTEKMKEIWDYFANLDNVWPGYDYASGAYDQLLQQNLQAAINITSNATLKVCKVYLHYHHSHRSSPKIVIPALECEAVESMDYLGNDGKCQQSLSYNEDTLAFADTFQSFLDHVSYITHELRYEERNLRKDIIRSNIEKECILFSNNELRTLDIEDTLDSGYCPDDFLCSKDYSDHQEIYNPANCEFKSGSVKLQLVCHDTTDGIEYERCEAQHLNDLIFNEIDKMMFNISVIERGDECRYDLETEIRGFLRERERSPLNKYRLLNLVREENKVPYRHSFCDVTKLLECNNQSYCDCVDGSEPREAIAAKMKVLSDYCYLTSGYCRTMDVAELVAPITEERTKIYEQYGDTTDDMCDLGNACKHVDSNGKECSQFYYTDLDDVDVDKVFLVVGSVEGLGGSKVLAVAMLITVYLAVTTTCSSMLQFL